MLHLASRYLAAQSVAREAGRLALDYLMDRGGLQIETKGPHDFVSAADRAVEALIADGWPRPFQRTRCLARSPGEARRQAPRTCSGSSIRSMALRTSCALYRTGVSRSG